VKSNIERFNINLSYGNLKFISIEKFEQILNFRNIYNLNLRRTPVATDYPMILIVEKKLNVILGFFEFKKTSSSKNLIASDKFNTSPIAKLNSATVEILDFEIADNTWLRLGFKSALREVFKILMSELSCEALVFHYRETVTYINQTLLRFIEFSFHSSNIKCKEIKQGKAVLNSDLEKSLIRQDDFTVPKIFFYLNEIGLSIWSEPIINWNSNELTLLLGQTSKMSSQLEPTAT
jgi:hypothetical protein